MRSRELWRTTPFRLTLMNGAVFALAIVALLGLVYLQTAVKTGDLQFTGPYAAYFTELMDRQKGAKYFTGMPVDILTGQCKDSFVQVMNKAFPGGLLSVDEAVKMMNQGCYKG